MISDYLIRAEQTVAATVAVAAMVPMPMLQATDWLTSLPEWSAHWASLTATFWIPPATKKKKP